MQQREEVLEGKVAAIITDSEIVINVGANDGAKKGDKFSIRTEPMDIIDPTTAESLGQLEREIIQVVVSDAQERFSVCQTFRLIRRRSTISYAMEMYDFASKDIKETLTNPLGNKGIRIDPSKSAVSIGDRAIRID